MNNGFLAAILLGATCALHADGSVTAKTDDTGEASVSPVVGWKIHFYSKNCKNYASKRSPADTLDGFPSLSTVNLRIPWANLEPEESQFDWSILNTPAQRWIGNSKRIAIRLTCSENWMNHATPEWVGKAGAKGTFFQFNKGRVERGNTWDPFFDNSVLQLP